MSREFEVEFVRWLSERLPWSENLALPIGDDAAVLAPTTSNLNREQIVVTTDLLSDGIDFRLGEVDPQRIGRKALAVNLSDLAAMAARPLAVVMAIALPAQSAIEWLPAEHDSQLDRSQWLLELAKSLYEGILPLAEQFNVPIAGGDTNLHDGPLVLSGTALGTVTREGPLTRSGGQPGDRLLVTGTVGGSLAAHQFDFTPRIEEALQLNAAYELHAGLDISDGLAIDTARLATSSGCGAAVDLDRLPISTAARLLENPVEHALADGEDFELLLAVPPQEATRLLADSPLACGLTDIGELVSQAGLWQRSAGGELSPLEPTGWLHGEPRRRER